MHKPQSRNNGCWKDGRNEILIKWNLRKSKTKVKNADLGEIGGGTSEMTAP